MAHYIVPVLALIAFAFVAVLIYRVTIGGPALERHRAWAMHWRIWLRLRPGDGFASLTELWFRWGRLAAVGHGKRARPSLGFWQRVRSPATDYAVRYGRAQAGRRAYGRMADQTLILAPPQTGKSGLLADRIVDHPGPVVTTSTRADLFTNTAGERARRGPVGVFNPLGIGGIPSTFAWDIIAGCEKPGTALRRAQDLTGDHETGDLKWWQNKASAALAALLHAAALAPWATMGDVYGWVNRHADSQAEEILSTAPSASAQMLAILGEIRQDGKMAESVRGTISECLTWCAIPELLAAVCPPPGRSFDVAAFLRSNGTLYLIAPGSEVSPVAPLFQSLVQHVHYEAGLAGAASPAGKLDPPLWLALDEVTQICPVPLPAMLADSAGKGILITAVVHSYGQLESRWGKPGAETVWAASGTKVLLGGITDPVTLEHVSRVTGTIRVDDQPVQVLPPELLRMLPKWRALILSLNLRPAVVKTRPVWHRRNRWFHRPPVAAPPLSAVPLPVHLVPVDSTTAALPKASNGHIPA